MQKIFTVAAAALAALTLAFGSALAAPPTGIPEPTTLALLAAGVGALAIVKFRGRR
jgi:hypothetical protein